MDVRTGIWNAHIQCMSVARKQVRERTMYNDVHRYLVSAIKTVPWMEDATVATAGQGKRWG